MDNNSTQWAWLRYGESLTEGTYMFEDYQEYPEIEPHFADLKTLESLKKHIGRVKEHWCEAPTGCLFDQSSSRPEDSFYDDHQGCACC